VTPEEALPTLRAMLDAAGVRSDSPDPNVIYRVFKDFARLPVEGVDDDILYEIGVYGFGEPETYSIDLVRQFSFYLNGEYDRMEQLHCTVHYEPDDDLRSLGTFDLWDSGRPQDEAGPLAPLEEFFHAVDARPEWLAVRNKRATRLQLEQWQV
jgi:hypothetical protein